jgi:type IV fimbrial biogenesis protein FimT
MARFRRKASGFTLIELMVSLAVIAILLLVAVPSFVALRQRQTLEATGEQVQGLWNQARLEAAKRNQLVKFGVYTSGGNYCLGAATTTDGTDSTPCDCTTAGACDVLAFPGLQSDWREVTIVGTPTLGTNSGVVVIEPHRSSLTDFGDAGAITFAGPPGSRAYRLNLLVDGLGRSALCESTGATDRMPAFGARRCAP